MNRRSFLSALTLSAAAIAVDPERLLWTPRAKTIFIPPVPNLAFHPDAFTMAAIDLPLPGQSGFYLACDGLWHFDGKESRLITPSMVRDGSEWPLRTKINFPLD